MLAADAHVPPHARAMALGLLLGLVAGGCGSPPMWRANIQSDNPDERVLAIRAVAEANDVASVPHLVDRLEDEDAAVRFYAILALRKITGERLGYDYAQPAAARARAVALWRNYAHGDRGTPPGAAEHRTPPGSDGDKPRKADH